MAEYTSTLAGVTDNTAALLAATQTSEVLYTFNFWSPFLLIALFAAILVSAWFVQTHPIFLLVSGVLLVLFIIYSGYMVNIFNEVAGHDSFAGIIGNYDIMIAMWQNMPRLVLIVGAAIMILLYARHRRDSNVPIQN